MSLPARWAGRKHVTYTYAILDVSPAAFQEVAALLVAAAYDHCFDRDVIDMHGIALRADPQAVPPLQKESVMPRKKEIDAVQIIAYFKTADLGAAKLVLQLARGEITAREQKDQKKAPPAAAGPALTSTQARRAPRPTPQAAPAGVSEHTASTTASPAPIGHPVPPAV